MFDRYIYYMTASKTPLARTDTTELHAHVDKLAAEGPLAVALIDLDGFGAINQQLGHEAGDRVLVDMERTLTGSLPQGGYVWRIGGDEYAVAVMGGSAEALLIVLDEVRVHLATHGAGDMSGIGMSIGVAARPPHADSAAELLKAADHALFRAKRAGGGQVAIYVEEKMVLKSNYYEPSMLHRLSRLSNNTGRTEASLLREALDDLLVKHAD